MEVESSFLSELMIHIHHSTTRVRTSCHIIPVRPRQVDSGVWKTLQTDIQSFTAVHSKIQYGDLRQRRRSALVQDTYLSGLFWISTSDFNLVIVTVMMYVARHLVGLFRRERCYCGHTIVCLSSVHVATFVAIDISVSKVISQRYHWLVLRRLTPHLESCKSLRMVTVQYVYD